MTNCRTGTGEQDRFRAEISRRISPGSPAVACRHVSERAKHLFANDDKVDKATTSKPKTKKKQLELFGEIEAAEQQGFLREDGVAKIGNTTLDRVHPAMILFGAGRSEALKRFVVDDGVGRDPRFWNLADSLSKLYPTTAAEKRWVDGVLARKKGLGF